MIPTEIGLAYCNKLFFTERAMKDLLAKEREACGKGGSCLGGFLEMAGKYNACRRRQAEESNKLCLESPGNTV